ncbi:MAG: hypothetical protein KJ709_02130 [Nanoarchaeota archaeon]|nr:hypothetical protein [Nanoarchaeota archaeon]
MKPGVRGQISRLTESNLSEAGLLPVISLIAADLEKPLLPVSIFSSGLAPAEAVVKYLRERFQLSYEQLGVLLERSLPSISTTYHNACRKMPGRLLGQGRRIPLRMLCQRRFSMLETVVAYLKHEGLSLSEIARLLKKDSRTIWTTFRRWQLK